MTTETTGAAHLDEGVVESTDPPKSAGLLGGKVLNHFQSGSTHLQTGSKPVSDRLETFRSPRAY
jgi:hypothetical protein